MMLDAFFVALAVFVGVAGHELFGMAMLSRPIVVAPLAGLLLQLISEEMSEPLFQSFSHWQCLDYS